MTYIGRGQWRPAWALGKAKVIKAVMAHMHRDRAAYLHHPWWWMTP